jgi:sn-glycerol 3-phosphate transport system ATP-binding protein
VVAAADLAGATLGVRPEHVVVGRETGVAGSVDAVEYLGADSLLTCRVGDQLLTARVSGRAGLQRGDKVRLGWAAGAAHFFDGATQLRREVEWDHQPATMVA